MFLLRRTIGRSRRPSSSRSLLQQLQRSTITTTTTATATAKNITRTSLSLSPFRKFFLSTSASFFVTTSCVFAVAEYDSHNTFQMTESKLPRAYDAQAIANFWSNHLCVVACRIFTITTTVVPFVVRAGLSFAFTKQWNGEEQTQKQKEWGIELREMLSTLGPTFIKFGQMLSIRPDILPTPVLIELQKLCDAVPPFPTKYAIDLIEHELGQPVEELYDGLSRTSSPIAAASLGQVYKCTLSSKHPSGQVGKTVAVKVQRPDMVRAVSLDLYILRHYTSFIEDFKRVLMSLGYLSERKQFDVHLLDTFANASFYELDYVHEGLNQLKFKKHLATANNVYVPHVYTSTTTRKVLTTEWIEGVQLAKSSPETIRRLIPCGVECFLNQLLSIGFFHSDPHPGNLLVNEQGQLVLIDFGLCAEVEQPDTEGMTSAIVHLMNGDVPALVEDAIKLRFLPEDCETATLIPALQKVFDSAQLAEKEISMTSVHDFKTQERRAQFKHISRDLNQIFYDYPFVVPEYFALITRALIVLEGIAVTGDPSFDIFSAAYPYAQKRAIEVFGWSNLARIGVAQIKATSTIKHNSSSEKENREIYR
jgi:predicted unusual protein kinase regulating ubiquinone biosynthesis (AarF/ABC1/UbiB family)